MKRSTPSRSQPALPPEDHPLENVVRQLADQVRILRLVLDDLVTEVQWANENRPCSGSECARFHSVHTEKLATAFADLSPPTTSPPESPVNSPLPKTTTAARSPHRDGRLFS